MTPPSQYSRIIVLKPLAAFDVGDRPGEKADDHDQKQQVHHERPSSIDTTALIALGYSMLCAMTTKRVLSHFFRGRAVASCRCRKSILHNEGA